MKKILSFLLVFALITYAISLGLFEFTANAETSGYYTYTVANRQVTITAVDRSISGDIVVPSTLDGYPVTAIRYEAFYNCSNITSVTIPECITSIGLNAFSACSKLTEIIVDENNSEYCSIDGVMFNKSITSLIKYPMGKTETVYTIPNSVTSIEICAFSYAYFLTNVTIPDTVTSIGDVAFENCFGLTSITIPKSVKSIGDRVFEWGNLESVFYRGCKDEKAKIAIGSNNSDLNNATWHYNSCIGKAEHTYDNTCDTECNVCGDLRNILHIDADNDNLCDVCDEMLIMFGDINDDDKINNKDLGILMQYINGWNVQIDIAAADVNDDEKINNKDYVLIIRYINDWDVELQ